jgi:hypothetical protein
MKPIEDKKAKRTVGTERHVRRWEMKTHKGKKGKKKLPRTGSNCRPPDCDLTVGRATDCATENSMFSCAAIL